MPRHVAVLIFPGVQALDAVGPLEVFAAASHLMESRGQRIPYRLSLVGPTIGTQVCRSGYASWRTKPAMGFEGGLTP